MFREFRSIVPFWACHMPEVLNYCNFAYSAARCNRSRSRKSLATVTYDEEVKFFVTLVELLLDLRKKCNILLDRESAHKSEHGLAIIGVARPLRRVKEFGIHSALHQMAWPSS